MSYLYNKERIKEFIQSSGLTPMAVGRKVGVFNTETCNNWAKGSDIRVSTLLKIAEAYGIDLLEFFIEDGEKMSETYGKKRGEAPPPVAPEGNINYIDYIKEVSEMEKRHLRELMQKDIDLAKKEVEMAERIREKVRQETAADKQQIIDSYEARLTDRDKTIGQLQQQLAELSAQYKELEASGGKGFRPYGVTGMAESDVNWEKVK